MLHRLADRLAGAGVPDARRLVLGRGDDALARRVEGRGTDPILMLQRLADRLAGAGVPDARGLVLGGGDDAPPVASKDAVLTLP